MPATPSAIQQYRRVGPRLPTLFGRLSLSLDAHARQLATLENVRAMRNALAAGQSPLPAPLEPVQLLFDLACELSAHFAVEEGAAHFGAVARTRPDLMPRLVDLKSDHALLLRTVARIQALATCEERWPEIPERVTELLASLDAHERAEAELVEAFLY
jgi:hypothetical protein